MRNTNEECGGKYGSVFCPLIYFYRMNASTDFQMICQDEILSVFEFFTEIANHFPNNLYGQLAQFVAIFYLVLSSPFQMIVTSPLHKVHAHFIKKVFLPHFSFPLSTIVILHIFPPLRSSHYALNAYSCFPLSSPQLGLGWSWCSTTSRRSIWNWWLWLPSEYISINWVNFCIFCFLTIFLFL